MCFNCKCWRWTAINICFAIYNSSNGPWWPINKTTNQLGQQIKNKMQVKYKSIWFRISIWNVNIDLIFTSKMNLNAVWTYVDDSNWIWQQWATIHVEDFTLKQLLRFKIYTLEISKKVVYKYQKQPSRGALRKRTPIPKCDFRLAKQLYWNHTLARVFSCKSAAYFQNTFS